MDDDRLRRVGAAAGIAGPLLLAGYFAAPALIAWPDPGTAPQQLAAFALAHETVFFLGGWLQATGALASVVFFLTLVRRARAHAELGGLLTVVGSALLLAVVCIEAAMLEEVPLAAAVQDLPTVVTTFALSNGSFVRIFPLAPAPLVFAGVGLVLRDHPLLPRAFARSALVIAALFLVAGLAAVLGAAGVVLAVALSVVEALWIAAAATASARRAGPAQRPAPATSGESAPGTC